MSKIKINYCLKHDNNKDELKTLGIKKNNILIFKDKDLTFKMILDDNLYIERKNIDYELKMNFKKDKLTKGIYKINNLGVFDLKIKTVLLKQTENNLYLKYELTINNENNGLFELKLNYEVIE